jgi:protein mago nashi
MASILGSVGRRGKMGFDFLEFEFQQSGKMRYVNSTKYKGEAKIFKQAFVSQSVIAQVKEMVEKSKVIELDDGKWPEPQPDAKQELEVILGDQHISFSTVPIGSSLEIKAAEDPKGLQAFHHLTQDLRCLVLPLISVHFKINPLGNQSSSFE